MPIIHKRLMSVAAHRGDCYNFHENTTTAFLEAVKEGVDMIETDVHMSRDGALVLIHDHTLDRTTDGKGLVSDYTLEQLLEFNAGNKNQPEKIPLFEDFIAWASKLDITLNIEIKEYSTDGVTNNEERCKECVDKVIELVEKYGMRDRILINSFDAYVLEYCYKKHGKKYMLHGFYPYDILKHSTMDPDDYLYCACIFDTKNKDCYDYLIERGIEPWIGASVTSEGMLSLAIEYGAKLVTTNNPADTIAKIERISEKNGRK